MENRAVVITTLAQFNEILACLGAMFCIQFKSELAQRRVKSHCCRHVYPGEKDTGPRDQQGISIRANREVKLRAKAFY